MLKTTTPPIIIPNRKTTKYSRNSTIVYYPPYFGRKTLLIKSCSNFTRTVRGLSLRSGGNSTLYWLISVQNLARLKNEEAGWSTLFNSLVSPTGLFSTLGEFCF